MIKSVNHIQLDCQTYAQALRGHKDYSHVVVTEIEDLSGKVPHVGYGGASKSSYVSPKTGKTIYILERNGLYAPDAYGNDVWFFEADFTVDEAAEFLRAYDWERS